MDRRGKKPDETQCIQVATRHPLATCLPDHRCRVQSAHLCAPIEEPSYIGRAEDSDICIQDANLSCYHARIERRGNAIWIQDLDSTNGVYLNDLRMPPAIQHRYRHAEKC